MKKLEAVLNLSCGEKDQKIAQSTHENGYIKPRKTFWRNSKQLLILFIVSNLFHLRLRAEGGTRSVSRRRYRIPHAGQQATYSAYQRITLRP